MGTITISLDAELWWGFHDLARPPTERIESARDGWLKLIDLFEEFDIPATWAIVGHLFLEECDGIHADHLAPEGWFDRDPGGVASRESLWFAPALIQQLLDSNVDHEIAAHGFSHLEFGDDRTTEEMAISELQACKEVAAEWNVDLTSFVFPRNNIGHREVLADHGFSCYRGLQPDYWYADSVLYPLGRVGTILAANAPPLVTPHPDEYGLVNIPASFHLFTFDRPLGPFTRPVLGDVIVRKAKRGIEKAAEEDGVFHMWLHPNSLTREEYVQRVRSVISHLDEVRNHTELEIITMEGVAKQMEKDDG